MLSIVETDITTLEVGAIVNAANESLLGGGGVDGAIHCAAGPGLLRACMEIGGCPTGQARITGAFGLPSRWVIHAVGSRWGGGANGESKLLKSCYVYSLELAMAYGIQSIAFPGISTGVFGYPKQAAAKIAISVMRKYENEFSEIIACCFTTEDRAIYQQFEGQS